MLRPSRCALLLASWLAVSLAPAQAQGETVPEAAPRAPVEAGELGPFVRKAHAIAMHGEPKYGADFKHFDYVNPDAPTGGRIRLSATSAFDTFNPYNGKGTPAPGAAANIETLMSESADEPLTKYGLLAESVEWPEDRSWVIFTLRPEARWHDGKPVTVDDVIFSLNIMKKEGAPWRRFYYESVLSAETVGERRVRFNFAEGENRELPLIVGDLPILPKHYWAERDFNKTTLEPPLGSGPYRISTFETGRFIEIERVPDYWGAELPVNVGHYNFDRIRYEVFRDRTVTREALKAGQIDFLSENSAKDWATAYEIPAVKAGLLKKDRFLNTSMGGMQAFFMNSRRPPFTDRKVRQALAYAWDFNWANEHIFFGQYELPHSFFAPTELAARGLPEGEELEILQQFRGGIPEEVFTKPYQTPSTDGSGWPRDNLKRAFELLAEAGWVVRDLKLVREESGERMSFEIMYRQQSLERTLLPFVRNLNRLGIDVRLRLVDTSQYINRVRSFDFDMMIFGVAQSLVPGNEQRAYWSSAAADQAGSRNVAGINDPVVDQLVDLVIAAPDRESLVARTRALDRVLLWGHYVIPELMSPYDRSIYWDKFGQPEITPSHGPNIFYWWSDPERIAALEAGMKDLQSFSLKRGEGSGANWIVWAAGLLLLLAVAALYRLRGNQKQPIR